jgi:hypothetical protein
MEVYCIWIYDLNENITFLILWIKKRIKLSDDITEIRKIDVILMNIFEFVDQLKFKTLFLNFWNELEHYGQGENLWIYGMYFNS